jgi:hypothetical protein
MLHRPPPSDNRGSGGPGYLDQNDGSRRGSVAGTGKNMIVTNGGARHGSVSPTSSAAVAAAAAGAAHNGHGHGGHGGSSISSTGSGNSGGDHHAPPSSSHTTGNTNSSSSSSGHHNHGHANGHGHGGHGLGHHGNHSHSHGLLKSTAAAADQTGVLDDSIKVKPVHATGHHLTDGMLMSYCYSCNCFLNLVLIFICIFYTVKVVQHRRKTSVAPGN